MNFTEQLRKQLHTFHPLGDAALHALAEGWEEVKVRRKTILTRAGDTEQYLYFVLSGVQHALYRDEDGQEATLVFSYAPSFSGVVDSLLSRSASRFDFETLTSSHLLRLHYNPLRRAIDAHPSIADWIQAAQARVLTGVLLRQAELLTASAEDRYRNLLQRSPHLLNLVPHKYLASYIGVDATTFSKLLGRIRLGE